MHDTEKSSASPNAPAALITVCLKRIRRCRLAVALLLAVVAWQCLSLPAAAEALDSEVLDKLKHGTVMVQVVDAAGEQLSGSGCLLLERGLVVTNAHVLGMVDADSRKPQKIMVVLDSGESTAKTVPAELLGVDSLADLAALRIPGKVAVAPLKLGSPTKLKETQSVYILGFPFGKALGANITVTHSTVSSLRKENGRLKEIQLSGGIHPGNSGGPVVDDQGNVVGVSVTAMRGTTLGFAIPSAAIASFLLGRMTDYGTDIAIRDGDKIKILYHLNFADPLKRIKSVNIEHFQGPPAAKSPPGPQRPEARPDETPPVSVEIPYQGENHVEGELEVEPLTNPRFVYWFRPVVTTRDGKQLFLTELSGMHGAPFERRAQAMKFQPRPGKSSPMELTNESTFRLRLPGGKDESRSLLLKVVFAPEYKIESGATKLLLRYGRCTLGVKVNGEAQKKNEDFQRAAENVLKTSATIELDNEGVPVRTDYAFGKIDPALRPGMAEISEHMLQALELLMLPIPNGEVQPLQTFRVQRDVAAGMPGMAIPALVDLRFKYQGVHELTPDRRSAVFDFTGTVRPRRGDQLNIGGRVFGRVEILPETGEIVRANTDLKVDVDQQSSVGLIRITGTMHGEYKPFVPPPPDERKPDNPPTVAEGDKRLQWVYENQGPKRQSSGRFERTEKATWQETTAKGKGILCEEWDRNDKFVLLALPKKKFFLRLYDDHSDLRTPQGTWIPFYQGVWKMDE